MNIFAIVVYSFCAVCFVAMEKITIGEFLIVSVLLCIYMEFDIWNSR